MTSYRIAEAADLAGVAATTLRYYEDTGVVARPFRVDNGYRRYSKHDIDRLRFVARARQLNLSLDDLRGLANEWDTDDCSSVQHHMAELVAAGLRDTQQRVADLIKLAAQLQTVADRLQATPSAGPCGDDCPCVSQASPAAPAFVPLSDVPSLDGDRRSAPIVCSLDADAVPGRMNDWHAVLAKAVNRTAVDGGVALQFPADPDTASQLAHLAATEQQCCTFFDFRLRVAGPVIEFEVRTPPEAGDIVAMFATSA